MCMWFENNVTPIVTLEWILYICLKVFTPDRGMFSVYIVEMLNRTLYVQALFTFILHVSIFGVLAIRQRIPVYLYHILFFLLP